MRETRAAHFFVVIAGAVICWLVMTAALSQLRGLGGASAQVDSTPGLTAFAHETITVSTAAIGFTAATYAPTGGISARAAECTLETAAIREWPDGTAPTTTVGRPIASGTRFQVTGVNNMRNWKAIRSTGSDGSLSCAYYR